MKLLCFILGLLTANSIIPLLDGFVSWLLSWVEAKKSKWSEIVHLANIRLSQIPDDDEPPKHAIGFTISSCEEEDEEDEI